MSTSFIYKPVCGIHSHHKSVQGKSTSWVVNKQHTPHTLSTVAMQRNRQVQSRRLVTSGGRSAFSCAQHAQQSGTVATQEVRTEPATPPLHPIHPPNPPTTKPGLTASIKAQIPLELIPAWLCVRGGERKKSGRRETTQHSHNAVKPDNAAVPNRSWSFRFVLFFFKIKVAFSLPQPCSCHSCRLPW